MVGISMRQVEIRARVKFGRSEPRDVYLKYDNKVLRMFKAPCGYVLVVDDEYYRDYDVIWGDTPAEALQEYYDRRRELYDAEVLEAEVIREEAPNDEWNENWEEDADEEEEEEFWELMNVETDAP
jgi:rRNA maturation endonuclease Nob1